MLIDGLPGGDFTGCVAAMTGEVRNPEAFCAWKEHELTGKWPTEEALSAAVKRESAELHETFNAALQIRESKTPHTVQLDGVLIAEGRSANNNVYTLEALQSAGAVFAGKPIRVNHPSRSEDRDRPEGDLWSQVGRLPDAEGFAVVRRADGVNEVRFTGATLTNSREQFGWISDHIRSGIIGDMSINAGGEGVREADGAFTVSRFTAATSHDLVTTAAAGGKATALHEADNGGSMKDKEKIVATAMAEAGLPQQFKALIEAEVARVVAAEDEDVAPPVDVEKKQETAPEFLTELPEDVQAAWVGQYEQCMASEGASEMACSHQAWLGTVLGLLPTAEADPEEDKDKDKTMEAARVYAQQLRASLAAMPGAGAIQGMGGGSKSVDGSVPTTEQRYQRTVESFARLPGFTQEMAEVAAGGR